MEITTWLSGDRDYFDGVELFKQYGTSVTLLKLFQSGENSYTVNRLEQELKKLLPAPKIINVKIPINKPDGDPEVISVLRAKATKLYKTCSHLHAQLTQLQTDAERLTHSLTILDTMDEVERLWDVIDHYDKTGEILQWGEVQPQDNTGKTEGQLFVRRNALRTQKSKLKAKIEKGGDAEKISDWTDKMNAASIELDQVDQLIKKHNNESATK